MERAGNIIGGRFLASVIPVLCGVIGVFAANPLGFHAADGSGYRFVGEIIAKLDKLNPLAAARLAD